MLGMFSNKKSVDNDVLIILGMHRSGTSCLTGILQQAGLELGDVVEAAPFNKKGNRESLDIMALNDDLLAYNGGSWDAPPNNLSWTVKHKRRRDKIIARYAQADVWGFKDPRTLFTLPFWLEGLHEERTHYIGTFRQPLAVAKSLNSRQAELSIESGLKLWAAYNEALLYYQKKYGFPLVNFDLEPQEYMNSVLTAINTAGAPLLGTDANVDFFDSTLRHQKPTLYADSDSVSQVLDSVMPIYHRLCELA